MSSPFLFAGNGPPSPVRAPRVVAQLTVARVEVFVLTQPVSEARGPAPVQYRTRSSVFVRIEDESGGVGWGETYAFPGVAAMLTELGEILLGKDAGATRPLMDEIASVSSNGFALGALSIALDDLRARLAGVPVFALYGGRRRDSVRAYASSGGYLDQVGPEVSWPKDVSAAVEAGFSACKVRIGRYSPARELPLLGRLRADSAPELELMVDANGAYSLPTAVEVGRALGQFGYKWLEEPLTRTRGGLSYPGYEALPPALDIAVAGGEGFETRSAFAEFLGRRAVDIVQPDVTICGGIGEALFISELASLQGCLCVPHAWGGAVTMAATLQLASLLPEPTEVVGSETPMLEYDVFENPMRTQLLGDQLKLREGRVTVPDTPGLGIELDEAWIRHRSTT